jgi:hypothetical protein
MTRGAGPNLQRLFICADPNPSPREIPLPLPLHVIDDISGTPPKHVWPPGDPAWDEALAETAGDDAEVFA